MKFLFVMFHGVHHLASVRISYVRLLEDDCDHHALHILGDCDEDRIVIDVNEDDMNYLLRDFGPNAKKLAQRYDDAAVLGVILDDQVRNIYAWRKLKKQDLAQFCGDNRIFEKFSVFFRNLGIFYKIRS